MMGSDKLPLPIVGSMWLDWDDDECLVIHVEGAMADLKYDDGSVWHAPWMDVLKGPLPSTTPPPT